MAHLSGIFKTTITSTGLTLYLFLIEDIEGGRVILYGDRDKVVFEGSAVEAHKVFEQEKVRYELREREGDPTPGTPVDTTGAFPVSEASR